MLNKNQTTAIVFLAGLFLAFQLYSQRGLVPSADAVYFITPVVSGLLMALAVFDRWAWHWPIVRQLLARSRPDLRGTWRGSLTSSWVDPATKEPIAPLETFLVVRQTFSSLSIRLLTAESASEALAAEVVAASDATSKVVWVYRNEPRSAARSHSEIHFGGACVNVVNSGSPSSLEGHYWTDRSGAQTTGELWFAERVSARAESYSDAQAAFARGRRRTRR